MEYQDEYDYDYYEEDNSQERNPTHNYLVYPDNQRTIDTLNAMSTPKYTQRLNSNSYQRSNINYNKDNKNYYTRNNYSEYQNNRIIDNPNNSNSNQYYSKNNKYLITFNSNPRKLDLKENISKDGVIRGYTNNCSFYVSGSSDLKSIISNKNKDYKNILNKTEEKRETNKTNNIYNNKNNYNINNYAPKKYINNNYKVYSSSSEKNYGQYKYKIPITSNKLVDNKPKTNNIQNEPSNNFLYVSQNTPFNPNRQYTSNYNSNENKYDMKNTNYNSNINNLNQRRVYKTSTNTNLIENTRKNYFKTEEEPQTNQIRKRNNTPNTSRLNDEFSSANQNKNNYRKIIEEKKGRHTASEIPHNFNIKKYIYNNNVDKNKFNNTQPRLNKVN